MTTNPSLNAATKKEGLITIQGLFLIDPDALKNGFESAEQVQPDFLVLMLGVVPHLIVEQNITFGVRVKKVLKREQKGRCKEV